MRREAEDAGVSRCEGLGTARREKLGGGEDGSVVAMKGDEPVYSNKKPSEALTPAEWATDMLPEQAPHLFPPSGGGGAHHQGGPGGRKIDNDAVTFGKNIEDIAAGKVTVNMGG